MKLKEWTEIFLKHRDLSRKEIEKFENAQDGFLLKTKKGEEQKVVVAEELQNVDARVLVCINTTKNVDVLIEHWKDFATRKDQLIVFSNPKTNQKWLIRPHLHAKIADPASLEQGLRSMSESIARF